MTDTSRTSAPAFVWGHAVLVVVGGAAGTAMRAGLMLIDAPGWQAVAVPAINVVGAFVLGVITGWSASLGPARAQRTRLLLGTGVMGGFTTYSAFAAQAVDPATLWLTLGTVVLGTLAAAAGLALSRIRRRSG